MNIPTANNWVQTYTGKQFYPLSPRVEDIDIIDIARALSMKCRYGGQTTCFYSVAQHCVIMSEHVAAEHALWALLHDAAEAYLPDVPRPIKKALIGFAEIEARLMVAIAERFRLPMPEPEIIGQMDLVLLETERRFVMSKEPAPWGISEKPLPITIIPLPWNKAEYAFLRRFSQLWETR